MYFTVNPFAFTVGSNLVFLDRAVYQMITESGSLHEILYTFFQYPVVIFLVAVLSISCEVGPANLPGFQIENWVDRIDDIVKCMW